MCVYFDDSDDDEDNVGVLEFMLLVNRMLCVMEFGGKRVCYMLCMFEKKKNLELVVCWEL